MRAFTPAWLGPALGLALFAPGAASANHGFDISGDYVMAGVDVGMTVNGDKDLGALLGLELSLVDLDREGAWIGAVLAWAWASCPDVGLLTLGGEIGYGLAGIEAGFSLDGDGNPGGRLRALGTVGVGSIYVGAAFGERTRAEFGILLKAPIEF